MNHCNRKDRIGVRFTLGAVALKRPLRTCLHPFQRGFDEFERLTSMYICCIIAATSIERQHSCTKAIRQQQARTRLDEDNALLHNQRDGSPTLSQRDMDRTRSQRSCPHKSAVQWAYSPLGIHSRTWQVSPSCHRTGWGNNSQRVSRSWVQALKRGRQNDDL